MKYDGMVSVILVAGSVIAGSANAKAQTSWPGVACWGSSYNGQGNVPADIGAVSAIAGGGEHTIALRSDGSIICWGDNSRGQCSVPSDLSTAVAIAGGGAHTIALGADGSVRCWGFNQHGQCSVPNDLTAVTAVAGGSSHTIALMNDGSVRCWGYNYYGQCNAPPDLGTALAVAGGGWHTIALRTDGSVSCWGNNQQNQCNVPPDLGTTTAIAGGFYHTVALRADGSVRCWGYNYYGQCNVPAGLGTVAAIAAGDSHTIALRTDGSVVCWGYNGYAQCAVPAGFGSFGTQIAGGSNHTIWFGANCPVRVVGSSGYSRGFPTINYASNFASTTDVIEFSDNARLSVGVTNEQLRALNNGIIDGNFAAYSCGVSIPGDFTVSGAFSLFDPTLPNTVGGDLVAGSITVSGSSWSFGGGMRALTDCLLQGPGGTTGTIVGDLVVDGLLTMPSSSIVRCESDVEVGGDLQIVGDLSAAGRVTIGGIMSQSSGSAIVRSDFASPDIPSISIGRAGNSLIRTAAAGFTELVASTELQFYPNMSTANRLVLRGGAIGNGQNLTDFARFETCTAPEYATVTPCLEFGPQSVIDLPPGNKIISNGPTTTLIGGLATLRNGATIETDADLAISGSMRIPVGNAVSLSVDRVTLADPALDIRTGGEMVVEFGSSMQIAAPRKASVSGALTVDRDALFSLLGGEDLLEVAPNGEARCFGGTIRSDEMVLRGAPLGSQDDGGRLVGVDALIDVDTVRVRGGSANLANSSVVGNLITEPLQGGSASVSTIAASGQLFGDIDNGAGKLISIGDLVVVGNVTNGAGAQILAQVGVLYITGNLVNNGQIFGNVITAPGFQGGGTGGTQAGDGIRVAGSVAVGPTGELRFVEELWNFSVCGDMTLACATDDVRFNGATLALDGCESSTQTLEATSRDLGCVSSAFSGEETEVSLIGQLEVAAGATAELVDAFDNAPGKSGEVIYARGLHVKAGAMLITNGIRVVTRNALIEGSVDDPANICVVPEAPDPDINGDGMVNGIDLAYILTYWNSTAPVADLDQDGLVGASDLTIVLNGWTG